MTAKKIDDSKNETTMTATIVECVLLRNDGPDRDAVPSLGRLGRPWPNGEVRDVEKSEVAAVLRVYDRPGRPMTKIKAAKQPKKKEGR